MQVCCFENKVKETEAHDLFIIQPSTSRDLFHNMHNMTFELKQLSQPDIFMNWK